MKSTFIQCSAAMYLIAHRGLSHLAPENTLAAFACALAAGFHGLETDVRLSADEELVLFHDRSTPDGLSAANLTRAELSIEMGYLVPTLAEALEAFPEAFWNIEIKSPSAAQATFDLLQRLSDRRQILLTSFRHDLMIEAAAKLDVECGLLIAHRPPALNTILYPAMPYPQLRTLVWDYEILDPALLQQANALGFSNWAYGAQTQYEHALCMESGLNGIITDYPEFVDLACAGLQ